MGTLRYANLLLNQHNYHTSSRDHHHQRSHHLLLLPSPPQHHTRLPPLTVSEALLLLLLLLLLSVTTTVGQYTGIQDHVGPLTIEQKCRTFAEANMDVQEFYSPLYPTHYPNNTDCTLHIEAEFGYIIRVDFRDYFEIEASENCENDFLEIRDGPHGYSDLMGRFCGTSFPPIITSQDRYLWLRFRSDENLDYRGFRAVYEFIMQETGRPEIPPCYFETGGVAGMISNDDIPQYRFNYSITYRMPIDCTWTIKVNEGHKIYLFFENFELDQPNECDVNFVDIFEAERDLRSRKKHFCGSVADSVVTTTNTMHVRFFAVGQARYSKFKAWFTSFRERIVDGEMEENNVCLESEYDCDDATCIDGSLECNGIKNCRHEYDEEGCKDLTKLKFDIRSQHIIVILTMGCGLLGGMCFAMCFNCIRKLISDGRQIQENIRRSREQLEDRSRSMTSIPSTPTAAARRPAAIHDEEYITGPPKSNGRPCRPGSSEESDEDEDLEDEMDDLEEETSVEMRDCECQTRDSMSTQRDSVGQRTPPPPPPPSRRPPGVPPPMSPDQVPTPPPPPTTHYGRNSHHPQDHYEVESDDDPYRYRAHAVIHVPEKKSRTPTKSTGKTTPDVLVTH